MYHVVELISKLVLSEDHNVNDKVGVVVVAIFSNNTGTSGSAVTLGR